MTDRKVTTLYFDYNVTHKIVAQEAEVSSGETVYLEAKFWERSREFFLPTETEDGASAGLAIEFQGKLYEIKGEIKGSKITAILTPNFIQLSSVLDCWFVWKVGGKVSPRFPLKLRVKYNPMGIEPPPETQPPPVERYVTVADQATGKVSPPVVEARLEGVEQAAATAQETADNALNGLVQVNENVLAALETADDALTVAQGRTTPQQVSDAIGQALDFTGKVLEVKGINATEGTVVVARLEDTVYAATQTAGSGNDIPFTGTGWITFNGVYQGLPVEVSFKISGITSPNRFYWQVSRRTNVTVTSTSSGQTQLQVFSAIDNSVLLTLTPQVVSTGGGMMNVATFRFSAVVFNANVADAKLSNDGYGVTEFFSKAEITPTGIDVKDAVGTTQTLAFPATGGTLATEEWAGGEFARKSEIPDCSAVPLGAVQDMSTLAEINLGDGKNVYRFRTASSNIKVEAYWPMYPWPDPRPPWFDGTTERTWEVRIEFTNKAEALSAEWQPSVAWVGHDAPEITVWGEYRFRMWSSDGLTYYATQVYPTPRPWRRVLMSNAIGGPASFDIKNLIGTSATVSAMCPVAADAGSGVATVVRASLMASTAGPPVSGIDIVMGVFENFGQAIHPNNPYHNVVLRGLTLPEQPGTATVAVRLPPVVVQHKIISPATGAKIPVNENTQYALGFRLSVPSPPTVAFGAGNIRVRPANELETKAALEDGHNVLWQ